MSKPSLISVELKTSDTAEGAAAGMAGYALSDDDLAENAA